MNRLAVINVVGLCGRHIGPNMPFTLAMRNSGQRAYIKPAFPALTCTAQSDYLTGKTASVHGIVGNGWYNRDLAKVQFWKQPNQLVQSPKIWDTLRETHADFTCAKVFWWFNMYSNADWSIAPRPLYPADGRKIPDIYTSPSNIRADITKDIGEFPFHGFWGPAAGRDTSQGSADCASHWIAESAIWIENKYSPSLSLIYLPHLDYNLQRVGPNHPSMARDLKLIDEIVRHLVITLENRGVRSILISEYGITEVNKAIHLNRVFREEGWLTVKEELGLELLDAGASRAFAVADHQVAHIYLNDHKIKDEVQARVQSIEGIHTVMDIDAKTQHGINHARAGDLIAVSEEDAWFTYYYWMEDERAPDFARTVDIHRKPGYDPAELFIDPKINFPKTFIATRLLQKKLGFRMLMDLIPLDPTLVKGSHGCSPESRADWPVLITGNHDSLQLDDISSTDIRNIIINSMN